LADILDLAVTALSANYPEVQSYYSLSQFGTAFDSSVKGPCWLPDPMVKRRESYGNSDLFHDSRRDRRGHGRFGSGIANHRKTTQIVPAHALLAFVPAHFA
jgi:hypothetical protein